MPGPAIQRSILFVSGAPGSGKSTVAHALASALPFALIAKDRIKETLFESIEPHMAAKLEHDLSGMAMRILWALAADCPQVILEANFRPKNPVQRFTIEGLVGRKLEIYCRCPAEVAMRRFAERAKRADHHPAHTLRQMSAGQMAEYDRPIGLSPVIEVDTTRPVEIEKLMAEICELWPDIEAR